jgi:hypothetical protein
MTKLKVSVTKVALSSQRIFCYPKLRLSVIDVCYTIDNDKTNENTGTEQSIFKLLPKAVPAAPVRLLLTWRKHQNLFLQETV